MTRRFTICLLLALAAAPLAFGQTARAFVKSATVPKDACLQVNFEISDHGGILNDPKFPSIPGFEKAGMSRSQTVSMGQEKELFRQIYLPQRVGKFKVPSMRYEFGNGKTYESPEFSVVVEEEAGNPNADCEALTGVGTLSDLLADLKPEHPTEAEMHSVVRGRNFAIDVRFARDSFYVHEQIVMECMLYIKKDRRDALEISDDALQNFREAVLPVGIDWERLEIGGSTDREVSIRGNKYYERVLARFALFPSQPGKYLIGEESLEISYYSTSYHDHVDDWIESDGATIVVGDLPGKSQVAAVGRYELEVAPISHDIETGETMDFMVTIRGTGHSTDLQQPKTKFHPSFESFDVTVEEKNHRNAYAVIAEKTFHYTLVPKKSGDIDMGKLEFIYFNTESSTLDTLLFEKKVVKIKGEDMETGGISLGSFYDNAVSEAGTSGPRTFPLGSVVLIIGLILVCGAFGFSEWKMRRKG